MVVKTLDAEGDVNGTGWLADTAGMLHGKVVDQEHVSLQPLDVDTIGLEHGGVCVGGGGRYRGPIGETNTAITFRGLVTKYGVEPDPFPVELFDWVHWTVSELCRSILIELHCIACKCLQRPAVHYN